VSSLWARDAAEALEGGASLVLLAVACFTAARVCLFREVAKAVYIWALGISFLGLLSYMAGIGLSERGGRLQGLLANANGAGVAAVLLLGIAPFLGRRAVSVAVPISLTAIVLTQSRSSALAAMVICLVWGASWTYRHLGWAGTASAVLVLGPLGAFGLLLLPWQQQSGLLRTDNSRSEIWEFFIQQFQMSPWIGVGWGGAGRSENFHLVMMAELGLLGGALAAVVTIMILVRLGRMGAPGAALALGILVSSVFEGWLLVGGSAFAWAVWLVTSVTPERTQRTRKIRADS